MSVGFHAVFAAEYFVVLGEKGLVDEDFVADGALEALRASMPLLALVGQPRVAQSNGATARLWAINGEEIEQ